MSLLSRTESQRQGRETEFAELFAQVPHRVRPADDRAFLWNPQLWKEMLRFPFPKAHEFWVTTTGDGRIGANVSLTNPRIGFIGFFEMNSASPNWLQEGRELLMTAENFLQNQGVNTIYGPVNFNTWFPYRFGLPHDDSYRFTWEPLQPTEYPRLWENFGFEICETYRSVGLDGLAEYAEKTKASYEKALAKGYNFRPFNSDRLEQHEIPALYRLSMEGFRDNFLFEPLSPEGFAQIYVPAMKKADLSMSFFALDENNNEVGFFYGFEDQGHVVLKTTAIHPQHRGQGLSNALTHLQAKQGLTKGCTKLITALVKDGAQSESYNSKARPLWNHQYNLYKKNLI